MSPNPFPLLADTLEALARLVRELPLATDAPPAIPAPAPSDWMTVRQFSTKHPAFPMQTVRNLVAARGANGFLAQGIVKEVLRRKIVLDERRFLAWLLQEPESSTLALVPPANQRTRHG